MLYGAIIDYFRPEYKSLYSCHSSWRASYLILNSAMRTTHSSGTSTLFPVLSDIIGKSGNSTGGTCTSTLLQLFKSIVNRITDVQVTNLFINFFL